MFDLDDVSRSNKSKGGKSAGAVMERIKKHKATVIAAVAGVLVLALMAGFASGMIGNHPPVSDGDHSVVLAQASDGNENAEALPNTTRSFGDPFIINTDAADPFAGPMKLVGVVLCGRGSHLAIIETGGTAYVVRRGEKIADYWSVLSIQEGSVNLRSDDKDMTLQLVDR